MAFGATAEGDLVAFTDDKRRVVTHETSFW